MSFDSNVIVAFRDSAPRFTKEGWQMTPFVLLGVLAVICVARSASADQQTARNRANVIVTAAAPIFVVPDANRTPLRVAKEGSILRLLEADGQWYRVEFSDPELGSRVGFIQAKFVKPIAKDSATPATDVSVSETFAPGTQPPEAPRKPSEPPLFARNRLVAARSFERGWVDVNLGAAAATEKTFSMDASTTLFLERATFGAKYSLPTGAAFDFGGGVMLTPELGVGLSFTGTAHQDTASLSARIPHPTVFAAATSTTGSTPELLMRKESGANIQVMFVPIQTDSVRIRLFSGPVYYDITQNAISNIKYQQTFLLFSPVNQVRITGSDSREVEGTGWGFHIGGDASVFFTRVVGVGGFVRFSRGTIPLENTLASTLGQSATVDVKTGGVQVGGGLRLKF